MNLHPVLKPRYFDSSGNPLAGGKLYTYQSGTTTPQATYTDSGGGTPNANPVILDANGEANVWLDPTLSYKFVLKDSSDVTQWTVDGVAGLLAAESVATDSLQDGVLSADANGRAKMADGFLSADATGRAKMADGFVNAAKLLSTFINDFTTVTAVAGDYVAIADTSDSGGKKKALVSDLIDLVYRSVTTTDSPTVNDRVLYCSGASFTITLPTAVGRTGKIFEIFHGGTSFTHVYTLATTSAQTIGGVASGSYALYTNGEMLRIMSNGANWVILDHKTDTGWLAYTPSYNAAFGTVSGSSAFYRRQGDSLFLRGTARCGTTTGADGGFTLPGSQTIDTAKIAGSGKDLLGHIYGNATTTGTAFPATTKGPFALVYTSGIGSGSLAVSNQLDRDTGVFILAGLSTFFSSDTDFAFEAGPVPVTGWQP